LNWGVSALPSRQMRATVAFVGLFLGLASAANDNPVTKVVELIQELKAKSKLMERPSRRSMTSLHAGVKRPLHARPVQLRKPRPASRS